MVRSEEVYSQLKSELQSRYQGKKVRGRFGRHERGKNNELVPQSKYALLDPLDRRYKCLRFLQVGWEGYTRLMARP